MFQTKVVQKIKTHILCLIIFFRKFCLLLGNVEKYGSARQAIVDTIIQRMRIACCITKATDRYTHRISNTCFYTATKVLSVTLQYTYIAYLVTINRAHLCCIWRSITFTPLFFYFFFPFWFTFKGWHEDMLTDGSLISIV
jgi:hypothetical protein